MLPARPKVLCVDDEPAILQSLEISLRHHAVVLTADSGRAGLAMLSHHPDVAVVLSDMRMPKMNGADFLARCRERAPDATRMLLTGQADLDAAIAAINQGWIFRFLSKPCPPEMLIPAIEAAAELYRLRTAERVLLEQTLLGSIQLLTDVLAQLQPQAFGRALRLKKQAAALAAATGLSSTWQVEVAAMLSQLGAVTLPPDLLEALEAGSELGPEEAKVVAAMPGFTARLLGHLPRMEPVCAILTEHLKHPRQLDPALPGEVAHAARILRIVVDCDQAESRGFAPALALAALRERGDLYDGKLLAAYAELRGEDRPVQLRKVSVRGLEPGMVLAGDVCTQAGVLLAARGYQVTKSCIERLANFRAGAVREPIAVVVGDGAVTA